jgi:CheY-like chemotaxis protein
METRPAPATIILIEDNPSDVMLLREGLNQHLREYEMRVLSDGAEAMEFCEECGRDGEARPCVMVLDLHLPKYDGRAVLGGIRSNPALAHVRVVVWTTVVSPSEEREIREIGVRLYRAKPLLLDGWITLAGEILDICDERTSAGFLSTGRPSRRWS